MIDDGRIWAKLQRDAEKQVIAELPLFEHLLDVAAAAAALLAGGGWARPLACAAGRPLTAQDIARLVVLIALHDLGKLNIGFQARRDPKALPIGHEGQVAALIHDPALRATPAGTALLALLREWGANPCYLSALMAHHGRPREEFGPAQLETGGRNLSWQPHVRFWQPGGGYDPVAAAARLIEQLRARFPLAWEPGERLPQAHRFVAMFAGLVVLADWLGSDTRHFPLDGTTGEQREAMRARAADLIAARGLAPIDTPPSDFAASFGFAPRGVQCDAAAADLGPVALIEAETGSGKTEAALWRWLELRRRGEVDGLYFALPTRSAAVQLHRRVQTMLGRVWGEDAPEAVLAVPGYLRAGDAEGQALPGYEVRWDDGETPGRDDRRWAAERTNRFLAARVAVGTIDQALLGALRVKHAPVRAAALARSLLVVDEVHASDAFMGGVLERLLANHVAVGGQALLLSATLGGTVRARLLDEPLPTLAEAEAAPYPALAGRDAPPRAVAAVGAGKTVSIEVAPLMEDADAIAARAVAAAHAGASVLVVRNTVAGAVAVAQAVAALAPDLAFRAGEVATVHHSRFAREDRRLLDRAVEKAFGKDRSAAGRVLVGTQTLEQSLDIDADLLITDLAPMDVLLQRIGRLHRHARQDRGTFGEPRAIVLRRAERDLSPLLGSVPQRHGLGSNGEHGGSPYPDIRQIEATLRLLEAHPTVTIPADNRRLVKRALHPETLEGVASDFGTAWRNHAAQRASKAYADRQTALALSLDLGGAFRELTFPEGDTIASTRLGARDLLVDLDTRPIGPFGAVERIAIPHWMARGVTVENRPEAVTVEDGGFRFRLGDRVFRYGRWGLERER